MARPTLYIYMGLQASGKTVTANIVAHANPNTVIVAKDRIRLANPPPDGKWSLDYERRIVMPLETAEILSALKQGHDVIDDSTNFAHESRLRHLARTAGAAVQVRFFNVDVETCIARDRLRLPPAQVGEMAIRATARTYADQILYQTVIPYDNKPVHMPKQSIIITDMDGTLAIPNRPWHEHTQVMGDAVNESARNLLHKYWLYGTNTIVVTARPESCRADTARWLDTVANLKFTMLLMRPANSPLRDTEMKLALFDEHIRGKYVVNFVLDDRSRVVRMWRALGLCCMQVADGDY